MKVSIELAPALFATILAAPALHHRIAAAGHTRPAMSSTSSSARHAWASVKCERARMDGRSEEERGGQREEREVGLNFAAERIRARDGEGKAA